MPVTFLWRVGRGTSGIPTTPPWSAPWQPPALSLLRALIPAHNTWARLTLAHNTWARLTSAHNTSTQSTLVSCLTPACAPPVLSAPQGMPRGADPGDSAALRAEGGRRRIHQYQVHGAHVRERRQPISGRHVARVVRAEGETGRFHQHQVDGVGKRAYESRIHPSTYAIAVNQLAAATWHGWEGKHGPRERGRGARRERWGKGAMSRHRGRHRGRPVQWSRAHGQGHFKWSPGFGACGQPHSHSLGCTYLL